MEPKAGFWGKLLIALIALPVAAAGPPTISYRDAGAHVDQVVWVTGTVLRATTAVEGTYLLFNNDKKYLSVVVPREYLSNFKGSLGHLYSNKKIQAFGKVQKDGTRLLLAVDSPKKIKLVTQKET